MSQFPLNQGIIFVGFVDTQGVDQLARCTEAMFDNDGIATLRLTHDGEKYTIASASRAATPIAAPTTAVVTSAQFTIDQLAAVAENIVPRISEAYTKLGLPAPASKEAVTHASILELLRTALEKATAVPATLRTVAPAEAEATTPILEDAPPTSLIIDGMDRETLAIGSKAALKALFDRIRQDGLTAIADFTEWANAERILPEDGKYSEPARAKIAAYMIQKIEHPPKFAAGVHETTKAQISEAA